MLPRACRPAFSRRPLGVLAAWSQGQPVFAPRVFFPGLTLTSQSLASQAAQIPHDARRPFQQKNRRRDDGLQLRMPAAVPEASSPFVHAWISAWDEPRVGIAPLRADIWAMPLRSDIVHQVVTWQRACMRKGLGKTKHRTEVHGGGRKPRPQKGTGRSRQGSIRSPIWVGGGHAHPKVPRDFSYKLNAKVQSLGLKTALSDKYRRGALIIMRDYALQGQLRSSPSSLAQELDAKLDGLGVNTAKQKGMQRPQQHLFPL
jgi:50S ribosomal protein L4